MTKIKVIPNDTIEAMLPAKTVIRVVAMTFDGRRHTVEIVNPLGHPDNPMQDRHVEEKFMALAEPVLGPERCRNALSRWWSVCTAEDMGRLTQLLDIEAPEHKP